MSFSTHNENQTDLLLPLQWNLLFRTNFLENLLSVFKLLALNSLESKINFALYVFLCYCI